MENKKVLIKCDNCGGDFQSHQIVPKYEIADRTSQVKRHYYNCPLCYMRYTIMYTNPYIDKSMKSYQRMIAKFKSEVEQGKYNSDQVESEMLKITSVKNQILEDQRILAKRWD